MFPSFSRISAQATEAYLNLAFFSCIFQLLRISDHERQSVGGQEGRKGDDHHRIPKFEVRRVLLESTLAVHGFLGDSFTVERIIKHIPQSRFHGEQKW